MNYFIFKGRFQPFHFGHLQVVEKTIDLLGKDDILILAAMCSFDYNIEPVDKIFAEKAAEHRQPDRNPWGSIVALNALSIIAREYAQQCKILTTLMPYPNLAWPVIKNWIPENRIWIIPQSGEQFDNIKADFYQSQNETVIRVIDDSNISGKELREYYKNGNSKLFFSGIPKILHKIYGNTFL